MALPPLQAQTPGGSNPPPEESAKNNEPTITVTASPKEEKPVKRYFWCSWPDFRVAKADKPAFMFSGRYLETEDQEKADWILEISAASHFPCEIKELTEAEYNDGRFDQQVADSSD